ncbi:MAG: hypothetical protein M3R70_06315 [Actinomycetota bacterium]|nr:hypothetical protein [Actinomycetota bacterium]
MASFPFTLKLDLETRAGTLVRSIERRVQIETPEDVPPQADAVVRNAEMCVAGRWLTLPDFRVPLSVPEGESVTVRHVLALPPARVEDITAHRDGSGALLALSKELY